MATLILKQGREKSILRHHPWLFKGAIHQFDPSIKMGDTVDVLSSTQNWLARGAYSPHSQICIRIWSFENEIINDHFFYNRIKRSIHLRQKLFQNHASSAFRLINAESDGLPGLIVDQYNEYLVCQFLFTGVEKWKQEIVQALRTVCSVKGIYERSDSDIRAKEGLKPISGLLWGQAPPKWISIREGDVLFDVDIYEGHKTGFYLDQRDNRFKIRDYAKNATVLNCFAYTGGFCIHALKGEASHVVNIESSGQSLDRIQHHLLLNQLSNQCVTQIHGDVFQILRQFRDQGRQFDMVILDPPKFVHSSQTLAKGTRGYKDINLLAIKLIKAGGTLFTFSCSNHVSPSLFQKIVSDAALDAKRDVQLIEFMGQAKDHPIATFYPEGLYLKGLVCYVG